MKKYTFILLAVVLIGCGQARTAKETQTSDQFEMPVVPAMITDPYERARYVAQQYWEKFDFTDTVSRWENQVVEQAFADYVNILAMLPPSEAALSIGKMLDAASVDSVTFARFAELYEKYLYDPNSPMRNEELYIPVLEYLIASPRVAELDKIRPQHRLDMALRNRVGTPAADFTYTLASGARGRLYEIKADYTILFFNNPDCPACKQQREEISASPLLSELIRTGRLKVLAVYPDENLTAWHNYKHNIPSSWINAYDASQTLRGDDRYELRAIPSLYLLGRDKSVLIKDAMSVGHIEHYLSTNA